MFMNSCLYSTIPNAVSSTLTPPAANPSTLASKNCQRNSTCLSSLGLHHMISPSASMSLFIEHAEGCLLTRYRQITIPIQQLLAFFVHWECTLLAPWRVCPSDLFPTRPSQPHWPSTTPAPPSPTSWSPTLAPNASTSMLALSPRTTNSQHRPLPMHSCTSPTYLHLSPNRFSRLWIKLVRTSDASWRRGNRRCMEGDTLIWFIWGGWRRWIRGMMGLIGGWLRTSLWDMSLRMYVFFPSSYFSWILLTPFQFFSSRAAQA